MLGYLCNRSVAMALLKVRVNDETYDRLFEIAATERRPIDLQAEWLLMKSLGLVEGEQAPQSRVTTIRRPARLGGE